MPIHRTCTGCGAAFTVPPSRLKYSAGLWCSPSCRYSTPGWTAALFPNGRKKSVCGICGVTFETVASNKAMYCSRACLGVANGRRQHRDPSKRAMKTCLECGSTFEKLVCLGDRPKFCSKACNALFHGRHRRVLRPTSIELALESALAQVGITTVREMKSGRFSIDLAIPTAKLAIEADGSYWHSLPKQIAADARKNAALAAQGWTVLRFGEDQINRDIASCVAVVMETLAARL